MSFLTDGIIKYIPENKYFIFEYKTEITQKFSSRHEEELTHRTQASCYSLSFGIDDTLFVYEDRNFCNKKAYHYHVTEEDKNEKVVNKIKACEDYLAKEKVPPKLRNVDIDPTYKGGQDRLTGPSSKICQYCNYKKECQKYL